MVAVLFRTVPARLFNWINIFAEEPADEEKLD